MAYTPGQSCQLKEHATASHGDAMIVAFINNVTNVDEPARCAALHSPWDLRVSELGGRLKLGTHTAHSRDHGRADLLEAGFESAALDRGFQVW